MHDTEGKQTTEPPSFEPPVGTLLTRAAAHAEGHSASRIRWSVGNSDWDRLARGLYAVRGTKALAEEQRWWAEVAALLHRCGPTASAWGRSTAILLGLDGCRFSEYKDPPVEVITPAGLHGRDPRVHRSRVHDPTTAIVVAGLRATSVVETLACLGATLPPDRLELALECSVRSDDPRRPDLWNTSLLAALWDEVRAHPRAPGRSVARSLLAARGDVLPTGSAAETLMDRALRRQGTRLDRQFRIRLIAGTVVRQYWLDLAHRDRRVGVEIDGRLAHGSADQIARDYRRDNLLSEVFTMVRYAAGRVLHDADKVAGEILSRIDRAEPRCPCGWTVTDVDGGCDVALPPSFATQLARRPL